MNGNNNCNKFLTEKRISGLENRDDIHYNDIVLYYRTHHYGEILAAAGRFLPVCFHHLISYCASYSICICNICVVI